MPAERMIKDEDDFEEDTLFDQAGLLTNKIKRHPDIHNVTNTMRITPMKTFALCLAFFGLGLSFSVLEPTLLDLQYLAGTDSQHIFYSVSARSVGYIFGSILGIMLFDRYNRQFLLFLSMIGMTLLLAILPWCNNLIAYVIILLILGMLMQLLYAGGNVLCLDLWGRQSGPFLQAIHFSLSLGLFIAPLLSNTISAGKTGISISESSSKLVFNNTCKIALPASALYNIHLSVSPSTSRHRRSVVGNISDVHEASENATLSSALNFTSPYSALEEVSPTTLNFTLNNTAASVTNQSLDKNSTLNSTTIMPILATSTLSTGITLKMGANGTVNSTVNATGNETATTTVSPSKPPRKPKPDATYAIKQGDKWDRGPVDKATPAPPVTPTSTTTSTVSLTTPNQTVTTVLVTSVNTTDLANTSTATSTTSIQKPSTNASVNISESNESSSNTTLDDPAEDVFQNGTHSNDTLEEFDGSFQNETSDMENVGSQNDSSGIVNETSSMPDVPSIESHTTISTVFLSHVSKEIDKIPDSTTDVTLSSSKSSSSSSSSSSTSISITTPSEESTTEYISSSSTATIPTVINRTSTKIQLPYASLAKEDENIHKTETSLPTERTTTSTIGSFTDLMTYKKSNLSPSPLPTSLNFKNYVDSSTLRGKNLSNDDKGLTKHVEEGKKTEQPTPSTTVLSTLPTSTSKTAGINCSQNSDIHGSHLSNISSHKKPDTFNNKTEENVLLLTDLMNKINELGITKVHIVYAVMAVIVFLTSLVFLSFLCQNPRELRSKQEEGVQTGVPESKFTSIMAGLTFVLVIFYSAAQLVFSQLYLSLVLQQSTHLLSSRGSLLISVFWGVYAFSRATSICCTNGFKPTTMLLVDFACCILSSATLAIFGSQIESLLWCSVAVMAIGLSSMFPYCLLWLEDYINISNKTACIILLGGSSVDLILSLTYGHQIVISSTTVMYLVLVCCVFAFLIFGIMWRLATWRGDKYGCSKAETQYHLASQIDDEEDSIEFSSGNTSLYLLNNGTNFSLPSWDRKNENSYIPLKHKKSKWK